MAKKRIDPKLPIPEQGVDRAAIADTYDDRLLRRLNELFREQDDGTIAVFDEEVYIGQATGLNFTGAGVTASQAANLPVGNYDITIPGGGGTSTPAVTPFITAEAHEAITKGQFVAVYDDGGLTKCRVAKSSSGQGYQADGWADANFSASATVTIYLPGTVNESGGTGLDAGDVWLGTDGYATSTPPTTAGYISQQIGVAESATSVAFEPQPDILIAATATASTGGTTISQEFTTSTTFVVPSYVGALWLTMVGAGGGAGSSVASSGQAGGGGGSGEYSQNFLIPVTPGETLTITIGAKGTGGTSGGNGTDGGTTSVAGLAGTFSVLGGKAGLAAGTAGAGGGPRGGAAPLGTNAGNLGTGETPVHFGGSSGGNGGANASTVGGAGAGSPGRLTGGAGGTNNANGGGGGGGASTVWGNGGAGGAGNAAGTSASASSYGAGGGGGGGNNSASQAGGDGAPGYVMIMYVA